MCVCVCIFMSLKSMWLHLLFYQSTYWYNIIIYCCVIREIYKIKNNHESYDWIIMFTNWLKYTWQCKGGTRYIVVLELLPFIFGNGSALSVVRYFPSLVVGKEIVSSWNETTNDVFLLTVWSLPLLSPPYKLDNNYNNSNISDWCMITASTVKPAYIASYIMISAAIYIVKSDCNN